MKATVLVVGPIEPPIGGVSRYCRGVVDLLRRDGMDAVPIDPCRPAPGGPGLVARVLLSPVGRVLGRPTLPILRAVRRHRVRLVLDNHQSLWRDPASARGVRLCVRVPYALVIHDGAFPGFVETLEDGARRRLSRTLGRLSRAFCMSDPILETVLRTAPGARVRRLSPLLQAPDVHAARLSPELEAFFGAGGPVISASGALHPQYGLEELFEAMGGLRARGRPVRLVVLLGSFIEAPQTSAALAEARARFGAGTILALEDFPDGAAVIARSDLYVRPSRVDSFGTGLHEALLSGVPVVATEHPTRPEGVVTYAPGDPNALARAIERGLTPEAKAAAATLAPRLREAVQRNRRETLEVLTDLAAAR